MPNPLNRYTLSERNKFITNTDGSVDLYLQADSPGKGKEANWLPAPKAKFVPMMRLYWGPKKLLRRSSMDRGNPSSEQSRRCNRKR